VSGTLGHLLGIRAAALRPCAATLNRRGKNTWRAKLFLGRDEHGRKKYLSRTIRRTKKDAESVLSQMLVETGLGGNVVTDATLSDLANRWMAIAEPTLSPTTYPEYRRLLDRLILPRLGPTKLRAPRKAQIDSFYSEIRARGGKEGPAAQRHQRPARPRLAAEDPQPRRPLGVAVRQPGPARQSTGVNPPSPEQIQWLLIFASEHDPELTTYLRLAAVTGARRGELCALRWRDLDGATLTVAHSIAGRSNNRNPQDSSPSAHQLPDHHPFCGSWT